MGAELEDGEPATRRPTDASPGGDTDASGQHEHGYVQPESNAAPTHLEDQPMVSGCTRVLLIIVAFILILLILISPRPLYTLLFVLLALLPAYPIVRFIQTSFQDDAVSRNFLVAQFLLGALPLVIVASNVEWILTFAIGFLVFRNEVSLVETAIENGQGSASFAGGDDLTEQIISALSESIPLWKIIIFFLLIAYVAAGMVEEVGKWIVARRYRKIDADNAEVDANSGLRVGCRGILATACMGALGFAATENVFYVLGIAQASRAGFSFGLVGLALFRGILAYPVHVGTQFFVAVSAAQRHVFEDKSSVPFALFIAVLFHGTFDGVALICMVLISLKKVPSWIAVLVPVFDIMLIGLLLLLCRGRYKALLERERVVLMPDPV